MTWLTAVPRRARLLIPVVVVGLAVVTMVVGIWHPDRIFFDEVYYVNDARDILEFGVEQGFVVHPPLGKLLIATGIWVAGDGPVGWRLVGGLLAVASVWLTYLLARRLGLRLAAAGLAGLVLALDGVFIAQARTAMLDIHLAFFVVLGAYALVRDRDRLRVADDAALAAAEATPADRDPSPPGGDASPASEDPPPPGADPPPPAAVPTDPGTPDRPPTLAQRDGEGRWVAVGPSPAPPPRPELPRVGRWWLVLAGAAFGGGVAVKWSGALALLAAGLVWLVVELARRRRVTGRVTTRLWGALGLGVLALGLVPMVTYAVTWTPWFVAFDQTWIADAHCDGAGDDLDCTGPVGRVRALASYHERMIQFHIDLEAEHAYRAEAWNWPIQRRPVVFYYESCSDDRLARVAETDTDGEVTVPEPCRVAQGEAAEILDVGNPAAWWLLLAGLPVLGMLARRRDRDAAFVLAFYGAQFLPWLLASRPVFNFYTVPLVPFVALALGLVVDRVTSRDRWVRASLLGLLAGSVVLLGTVVGDVVGTGLLEPVRWYAVGVAALLGGALVGGPAPDPRGPPGTRRRWPTVVVAVVVVAVGLYFLPVWTGIAGPEEFVKSHWWLPTWI